MPYEKSKASYQDDAYRERERRKILDVRNWNSSNGLSVLVHKINQLGISINYEEVGIDSFKRLLLEMCIREARWIGKHPNSLKLQKVPIEEFEKTCDYGLKDITKLDDFNQVFD